MKVREIITPKAQCTSPEATLMQCAAEMKSLDVGMLPICDDSRLVGAITDRDITVRAVARGLDPHTARVREVMSEKIVYCFDDQEVEDAAQIMEKMQIRRLPVLDHGKRLVGMVSLGDIATRSQQDALAGHTLAGVSSH
ncbi:MAG TPA: CBS domain-containing protein [Verrucomicrobiae bacterium]|nr:CBS domain-containing protein [Verrucomicrobiae bacterium]